MNLRQKNYGEIMKDRRRSYSISEKLKAIKLAEIIGFKAASEQLNIDKSLIYRWRRKREFYESVATSNEICNNATDDKISKIQNRIIKVLDVFTQNIVKGIEQGCYTEEQIIRLAKILLPIYVKIVGLDRKDIPREETPHKIQIEVIPTREDE